MSTSRDEEANRLREYEKEMLRASYASLFWAVITERRKQGTFTLQSIADALGIDKSGVSRWFSSDAPNWELNSVAEIADVLNIDLQPPTAIDRVTHAVFTPAGIQPDAMPTETTSTDPTPPPRMISSGFENTANSKGAPPKTSAV